MDSLGNSLSGGTLSRREQRLRPRKTPRQARAAETRARILDAAASVFESHGYEAGTTNRIAEAASMSVGSLYQYFPNKDAILVELLDLHIADGAERAHEALAQAVSSGAPFGDVVRTVVADLLALHRSMPVLHSILTTRIPLTPDLGAGLAAVEAHMVDDLAGFLTAIPEVDVEDPHVAAAMVATCVNSLVHARVAATPSGSPTASSTTSPERTGVRRGISDEQFVEETARMVLCYLSPA